jgi:hypothetical protein
MKLKDTGHGDFEQPEAGSYAAICYKFIDIGTQTGEYNGLATIRHQIILGWELDEKMADGKPFVVSQFYTASLHEKSKLRAHLEAWRGQQFTPEELQGFEAKRLLGQPCMISLVKNEKGKIKVQSVSKLPKGMNVPVKVNTSVYFSLDEFDHGIFEALSDGIKKLVIQSPEYQALSFAPTPAEMPSNMQELPVPF